MTKKEEVSVKLAKDRIINALGVLYRIKLKTPGLTASQAESVDKSILGLEDEYRTLIAISGNPTYGSVGQAFRNASKSLKAVRDEREKLANAFLTAKKILSALTVVIGMI